MNKKPLFYFDEINVRIIVLDVLKNLWLAFLAAVIVCIGFFAYSRVYYQNTYKSEATFVISPRSNGSYVGFYSSLSMANEMAEVFKEVFSSDVLKRMIREDLENYDLPFTVSASVAKETNILIISAQSNSPENAHAVMQSVMKNYRRVSGYLFGGVVLDVLKKPHISVTPSNPLNEKRLLSLGITGAVMATVAMIVLISALRPTTKTLACAQRRMEEQPLGILRKEKLSRSLFKKQKRPLLISDASTSFRYKESILQIAHRIRHNMNEDGKKVLLVTSVAENEGKSTFSANLALALSKHGCRIAYVDVDLRKPAGYKIFSNYRQEDLFTCLKEGLPTSPNDLQKLHIITHNRPSVGSDKIIHSREFARLLSQLREKMDYVILDTSPYISTADTGLLLSQVDCCVMVMRQDWASYNVCHDVSNELRDEGTKYLGYVINQYQNYGVEQALDNHYDSYGHYGKSYSEE